MGKAVKVEVYGRVQGVNFRVAIKNYCDKSEINGYVLNKKDGSVVVVVQGFGEKLRELILWLESSPGLSKVERVKKKEISVGEEFDDFRIRYEKDFVSDQVQSFRNAKKSLVRDFWRLIK